VEKRLILHGDFLLQAIDGQTLSFEINYYLKDQNGGYGWYVGRAQARCPTEKGSTLLSPGL